MKLLAVSQLIFAIACVCSANALAQDAVADAELETLVQPNVFERVGQAAGILEVRLRPLTTHALSFPSLAPGASPRPLFDDVSLAVRWKPAPFWKLTANWAQLSLTNQAERWRILARSQQRLRLSARRVLQTEKEKIRAQMLEKLERLEKQQLAHLEKKLDAHLVTAEDVLEQRLRSERAAHLFASARLRTTSVSSSELNGHLPRCTAPMATLDELLEQDPRLLALQLDVSARQVAEQSSWHNMLPWPSFVQASYRLGDVDQENVGMLELGVSLPVENWTGASLSRSQASARSLRRQAEAWTLRRRDELARELAALRTAAEIVAAQTKAAVDLESRALAADRRATLEPTAQRQAFLLQRAAAQARADASQAELDCRELALSLAPLPHASVLHAR